MSEEERLALMLLSLSLSEEEDEAGLEGMLTRGWVSGGGCEVRAWLKLTELEDGSKWWVGDESIGRSTCTCTVLSGATGRHGGRTTVDRSLMSLDRLVFSRPFVSASAPQPIIMPA